jgi:predicted NBD/HSP70 family sugar kinase
MYFLFDIGGTKMRFAFSPDGKTFEEPRILPTPRSFAEGVNIFKNAARELSSGRKIQVAAGGITRALGNSENALLKAPGMPNTIDSLRKEFERAIGVPVCFENDSAVCGLGEALHGAGRGHKFVVYITVSTGVGGARIVSGKIDEGAMGFEPGHQIVDMPHSFRTEFNPVGDLQGFVSGKSLEKRFGKKPKEITDPNVWEELAGELAYGIHNSIVHWSPSVVVLGGSMITGSPAISVERTNFYLKDILKVYPEVPEIKKAELGDVGGLWGALEFAKQQKPAKVGWTKLFKL